MSNTLFWLSFPWVIPQALWVRKTALRSPVAGGDTFGVSGQGAPIRLLAIGDSIIAGVGASTLERALVGQTAHWLASALDAEVAWSAIGENGITSSRMIREQLPCLPDEPINCIIVSVGVNDVTSLTSTKNWAENLHTLLSTMYRSAPDAVIAFAGVPPMNRFPRLPQPLRAVLGLRAKLLDEIAADVINEYDSAVHVPLSFDLQPENFSADGFHPNELSYVEFGRLMAEALINEKHLS